MGQIRVAPVLQQAMGRGGGIDEIVPFEQEGGLSAGSGHLPERSHAHPAGQTPYDEGGTQKRECARGGDLKRVQHRLSPGLGPPLLPGKG